MVTIGIHKGVREKGDVSASPTAYEVIEFASVKPSDKLVSVAHYRTIYLPDGKIKREELPGTPLFKSMIKSFDGYSLESAGTLMGFFQDANAATDCARTISQYSKANVEVCGTQITIEV